jgi:hypothetical protein
MKYQKKNNGVNKTKKSIKKGNILKTQKGKN